MSYIKAVDTPISFYVIDKKRFPNGEGYLGLWLSKKLISPFRTLQKGEIFSKPYVKTFVDNYGNTWVKSQEYTTGLAPYGLLKNGESDLDISTTVLSPEELKNAKAKDEAGLAKTITTAVEKILKFGIIAFIGWQAIKFFSSKK